MSEFDRDEDEVTEEERRYDELVAPLLLEAGRLCEALGFSFVAAVEWSPGEMGTTHSIQDGASAAINLVGMAALSHGNVDSLFIKVQSYAKQHGHNSVILASLDRMDRL